MGDTRCRFTVLSIRGSDQLADVIAQHEAIGRPLALGSPGHTRRLFCADSMPRHDVRNETPHSAPAPPSFISSRAEKSRRKQAPAARSRSVPSHSTSRSLTESNSQPGVETGVSQEKSRPVAAFSFQVNNLQKIVGGVDGARTRDPRRDRPVF